MCTETGAVKKAKHPTAGELSGVLQSLAAAGESWHMMYCKLVPGGSLARSSQLPAVKLEDACVK